MYISEALSDSEVLRLFGDAIPAPLFARVEGIADRAERLAAEFERANDLCFLVGEIDNALSDINSTSKRTDLWAAIIEIRRQMKLAHSKNSELLEYFAE